MKVQPSKFNRPVIKNLRSSLHAYFIVIVFITGILPAKVNSQINKSITINSLLASKSNVSEISFEKAHYVNVDDREINTMPQFLLKDKQNLWVFINGSGRLYKVTSTGDSINYTRIDTTYFSGYNIGSFPFVYNDTIYSLGGSGFWRVNGQLRVYIPKTKQWDIMELNKEVPILYGEGSDLVWYDIENNKIYIGKYFQRDQATNSSLTLTGYLYRVKVLNLITKEWSDLGDLSSTLKDKAPVIGDIASTPWGQFALIGENYAIIDYQHNQILYLNRAKQDELRPLLAASNSSQLFYFKDSTFFYGSSPKNKLDSIPFSLKDFILSKDTVYTVVKANDASTTAWLLVIPLIAVIIPLGLYKLKAKPKQKGVEEVYGNDIIKDQECKVTKRKEIESVLDEVELQTFRLIIKNTLRGATTSIDEVNKVLGVSKKSNENQKKQRSDTILSINSKYSFLTHNSENIILKRRCEMDKRSFEYFIDFANALQLEKSQDLD